MSKTKSKLWLIS